jgi:hypothetical protein
MSIRSCSEARLALACAAGVLAAAGCGPRTSDPDVHAVRTTVVRYNQRLVEAYRRRAPELLEGIASPTEIARTSRLVTGLLARAQYMEARQDELRFESVRVSGANADADTEERWAYEHRSLASPDARVRAKEATYRLKYRLKREGGAWIVDEVLELGQPSRRGD